MNFNVPESALLEQGLKGIHGKELERSIHLEGVKMLI
jgi:hypothetical protein